jgi:hypothetical protein
MAIKPAALVMLDPECARWVNPVHVVSVEPNSRADDRARVELSTGKAFLVNGSAEAVAARLNTEIVHEDQ